GQDHGGEREDLRCGELLDDVTLWPAAEHPDPVADSLLVCERQELVVQLAPAQQDELEGDAAPPELAAGTDEDVESFLGHQPSDAHDAPRPWRAGWDGELGQVDPVPADVDLSRRQ